MSTVAIAGAGPVGLTAALSLARRGIDVTVLEQGPRLATESRASTFHPPTLEMLRDLGVVEPLLRAGLVAETFQYRERGGDAIATLDMGVLARDTAFPYRVQCEQSKLTPLLLDALPGTAEVRFDHAVTGVAAGPRGVAVSTSSGIVHCDWLIGADGAHSAVRHSLGADFTGSTYPGRFLVASVEEDLESVLPGIAPINYVFDPDEWLVLLRTPDHWRVLLPTAGDTPDEDELRRLPSRLDRVADLGRPWRIAHATLYRVHERVTPHFRTGRVLLAGDAAHVNNPLGGLGMNSGIHDAVRITDALADVLSGAPERVLDDAARRRHTVAVEHVQRTSRANWSHLHGHEESYRARLRALAADPVATRAHLRKACLMDSLEPAG
ncbi:FAD-dependent oxidoreductase [Nocardia aurantia]|uniref:Para-nitrophenol 4-monooxygenase n=1 Tax=Nocardia aurantia TaxID=2585199 RepID=A0A7K0DKI3_9NOCA|nr:NAD(P)/FAD-dependent oxidoreductase [Nocardia aurantia]MQY26131.1 Para-nitrophenol 4-monooxygenase [Nocardia aurantia]